MCNDDGFSMCVGVEGKRARTACTGIPSAFREARLVGLRNSSPPKARDKVAKRVGECGRRLAYAVTSRRPDISFRKYHMSVARPAVAGPLGRLGVLMGSVFFFRQCKCRSRRDRLVRSRFFGKKWARRHGAPFDIDPVRLDVMR